MKIALELDDFSPRNSNFGLLDNMREHYKDFKVSLFTTPWEIRWGEQTPITLDKFKPFTEAVRNSDWIEVCVHGLTHAPLEFAEISYDNARKRVIIAEKMFANRGITFTKIFKAPFWQVSEEAERALKDLGYYVCKDGYYDWNLADDYKKEFDKKENIIAHGHIQKTCGNGLEEVYPKLMDLPANTEWLFLSDIIKAEKVSPKDLNHDNLNNIPGVKKK